MNALLGGLHLTDLVDDLQALDDLAEDGVTDLVRGIAAIQEGVVLRVDVKLSRRAVGGRNR